MFQYKKMVFVLTNGVHHQALLCKRMVFKYIQFCFLHKRSPPYNYHMLQLYYCTKNPPNAVLVMHNINFYSSIFPAIPHTFHVATFSFPNLCPSNLAVLSYWVSVHFFLLRILRVVFAVPWMGYWPVTVWV